MAGHNRWSQIKRKKGANDAKRGKIFTKLIREITLAAREGGGDQQSNARLRSAIMTAKSQNMPNDNIDRAIKKGTGELDGGNAYVEYTYEGYGPGGTAIIVDTVTDNKTRTTAEVRHIFSKYDGNLGEPGSVAWNFELKGTITLAPNDLTEDQMTEIVLESGADDFNQIENQFEIITETKTLEDVKSFLEQKEIQFEMAELTKIPKSTVSIDRDTAEKLLKLVDLLEDNDDVQKVYSNSELPEDLFKEDGS